jgi:hypothetical protein
MVNSNNITGEFNMIANTYALQISGAPSAPSRDDTETFNNRAEAFNTWMASQLALNSTWQRIMTFTDFYDSSSISPFTSIPVGGGSISYLNVNSNHTSCVSLSSHGATNSGYSISTLSTGISLSSGSGYIASASLILSSAGLLHILGFFDNNVAAQTDGVFFSISDTTVSVKMYSGGTVTLNQSLGVLTVGSWYWFSIAIDANNKPTFTIYSDVYAVVYSYTSTVSVPAGFMGTGVLSIDTTATTNTAILCVDSIGIL